MPVFGIFYFMTFISSFRNILSTTSGPPSFLREENMLLYFWIFNSNHSRRSVQRSDFFFFDTLQRIGCVWLFNICSDLCLMKLLMCTVWEPHWRC